MEQSAVQHRLKPAPQTLQMERVSRSELNLDPTVVGLLSGDRQCRLSHVNAQNRQSQRGDVKSVLAGPAARIEHRSSESALGCQTHYCWLRLANIPRRRVVVVRQSTGIQYSSCVTSVVKTYCCWVLAGIWKSTPRSSLALRVAGRSRSASRILWVRPASKSNSVSPTMA